MSKSKTNMELLIKKLKERENKEINNTELMILIEDNLEIGYDQAHKYKMSLFDRCILETHHSSTNFKIKL